jgi:hypothetical protein
MERIRGIRLLFFFIFIVSLISFNIIFRFFRFLIELNELLFACFLSFVLFLFFSFYTFVFHWTLSSLFSDKPKNIVVLYFTSFSAKESDISIKLTYLLVDKLAVLVTFFFSSEVLGVSFLLFGM